jgi:hypothetical protein
VGKGLSLLKKCIHYKSKGDSYESKNSSTNYHNRPICAFHSGFVRHVRRVFFVSDFTLRWPGILVVKLNNLQWQSYPVSRRFLFQATIVTIRLCAVALMKMKFT